jgi:3-carboxy-cis,cis-muconate cycloisomerase
VAAELLGAIVVTDELAAATGDEAWLAALLDAEVALARAEADLGVIPRAAADAIAVGARRRDRFELGALGRAARLAGNPAVPLVDALAAASGPEAKGWVHWGATSQDIVDTAAMLVTQRALVPLRRDLAALAAGCAALAATHRHTLMAGRTLLQQALPVTFGLVAAGWLSGVLDAAAQLRAAEDGLAAQLGGAAGTLASLGDDGPAVLDRFAVHVGLAAPSLPWHTARQRITAVAGALATAAGTAAKIAGDVALLMQTEVAEVFEPAAPGRGGSSTLPHKRNPVAAAAVNTAARQALALLPVLYGSLLAEHQRPVGAWQAEWESLSSMLALSGSAVAHTAETVADLEVHPEAMAANLERTRGLLLAERVSLVLAAADDGTGTGATVGRPAAKAAVERASRRSVGSGRSLGDELADEALAVRCLTPGQITELLDPAGYLGSTQVWIGRALAAYAAAAQTPARPSIGPDAGAATSNTAEPNTGAVA